MSKSVRGITINTDASFYEKHSVGGYAFWIVCDLFKITKSGKFKQEVFSATECELKAIGNAIATLLAQKELPKANFLVINTDSKQSIAAIENPLYPLAKEVRALYMLLIKELKVSKHSLRHVKAHSGKSDARSKVNEWCDSEAKKWAKIAIKEKQQLTIQFNDKEN